MSSLADALFTVTQQRLLTLLFGQPERSFYTNEILRHTGMGVATVTRELDSLLTAGILKSTRIGNQRHYQANPQCPVYTELSSIVKKTMGVVEILRNALTPMAAKIKFACVYGSIASGKEVSASDIDLLLIGKLDFAEVVTLLYPAQSTLGREINPKIMTQKEWELLRKQKSAFIKELINKPRMDVIGNMDELG